MGRENIIEYGRFILLYRLLLDYNLEKEDERRLHTV